MVEEYEKDEESYRELVDRINELEGALKKVEGQIRTISKNTVINTRDGIVVLNGSEALDNCMELVIEVMNEVGLYSEENNE